MSTVREGIYNYDLPVDDYVICCCLLGLKNCGGEVWGGCKKYYIQSPKILIALEAKSEVTLEKYPWNAWKYLFANTKWWTHNFCIFSVPTKEMFCLRKHWTTGFSTWPYQS